MSVYWQFNILFLVLFCILIEIVIQVNLRLIEALLEVAVYAGPRCNYNINMLFISFSHRFLIKKWLIRALNMHYRWWLYITTVQKKLYMQKT